MKYPYLSTSLMLLLLSTSTSSLYAKEKHDEHEHSASEHTEAHDDEHEQHGTHEHGVATLSIAVGEKGVEVMLESPAANLLGFEHAANSAEDKKKLANTKATLEAGANLFTINKAAGCKLANAEVVSALLETEEEHNHDEKHEKEHAEHDHDEKHEKEHAEHDHDEKHEKEHAEHAHDDHEHKEGKTHNDMDVTWSFSCSHPAKVEELTVKLFSTFSGGFHKIKAEWVTSADASAQELYKDTVLKLK